MHARFAEELKRCPAGGNQATLDLFSCFGKCQKGVNVLVREIAPTDNPTLIRLMPTAGRSAVLYHGVQPAEVRRIVEEHVVDGRRVTDLIERGREPSPSAVPQPVVK